MEVSFGGFVRRVDQELFSAVEQGNLSETEKCLNRGANVLARNSHHTVLHSAVHSDNGEVAKLVLNKIKETQSPYIDAKDNEGDTPLMWTAETGNVNAARVLLEYGAGVEVKNNRGMTALHLAAKNDHIEVMKLLIDKGVNVNVQNNYGKTPLDCARGGGHGETAGYLVFSVAEMFRKQGKYNKAWQAYQEAFDIQEVVLGPNHLDTLRTRHNMAVVLRKQGKYGEALNIYQEIFDIQKRKDAYHPDTLMTRYNMAVVLNDQGKDTEALRIFREVLNIQKAKLGSDHPITLLTSDSIEIIQREKISGASFVHSETKDGHRKTVDIPDIITTEVIESESSSFCSSPEEHQEVQELDEECFCDELETARKGIIEYLKYRRDHVFIVRGKDRGKRAWHCVLIDVGKKEMFLEQCKTGSADVSNYVRILYSGWGENPPQDITDKVDEFFIERISDIFLIKGEDKSAYYYVLVNPDKKEMFQEQSKKGSAFVREIKDYGTVLYSGWGQDPPESISDRIVIAHFCTDKRSLEKELDNLSVNDDALHESVRTGQLEKVRYLIRKGANVNSADKNGWTSLHHAAYVGNLEVVKCLIDSRADLHIKDAVCERKPIHIAAREGNTGIVKLFLSKGAGTNDADTNSWTPLHYAVWNGHLETAKLLIVEGADIYAKGAIRGKKPIHVAANEGHIDIVGFFLNKGVSVDEADKEGRTSLYYAAWKGKLDIVEFLVDKGANIHAENIYGTKSVHVAADGGQKKVIRFFLSNGISVNDRNKSGETPLHFATMNGHLEVVKFLIKKGARVHTKTNSGETPLDYARVNSHWEVMDILNYLKCM